MALWDDVKQHTVHSTSFIKYKFHKFIILTHLERNNKLVKTYITHTTKQRIVHVHEEKKKNQTKPTYLPYFFKDETLNTHIIFFGLTFTSMKRRY